MLSTTEMMNQRKRGMGCEVCHAGSMHSNAISCGARLLGRVHCKHVIPCHLF